MINRRMFVALLAAAPLAACETTQEAQPLPEPGDETSNWYIASLPDQPHDIPLIDWNLVPQEFHRQTVQYSGPESVGTIVINIAERHLYLVETGGKATRYGIGVGRQGYALRGAARVGRKGVWPDWSPTSTMVKIRPNLPRYLKGGIDNPLGARALYLYRGNQDTLFRIHGTNEPWSIGHAVSSGCIRLMNEDILDLYNRVEVGAPVMIKQGASRVADADTE